MTGDRVDYWDYYENGFDWTTNSGLDAPDPNHTLEVLTSGGVTQAEAEVLMKSGYVCFPGFDVVIDRFYGGAIGSYDHVTRIPSSKVSTLFEEPKSPIWYKKVSMLDELKNVVAKCAAANQRELIFRGQTKNYTLNREVNNPHFTIQGLGEVSLLPSLWRKMHAQAPGSFLGFENLSLFEWSSVFYQAFDMAEIERQRKKLLDAGEWIYSMQDMADSDSELLREFGNHRLDVTMGWNHNLADAFATLLQHYGLLSPVLDLSSSLDVALFFATHKYSLEGCRSKYTFVGTNEGQSVIYIFSHNPSEMLAHEHRERALLRLNPLRPKRQSCVIARTSQYAINLPGYSLLGVIQLDFNLVEPTCVDWVERYFPGMSEDRFLRAIKQGLGKDAPVTNFAAET